MGSSPSYLSLIHINMRDDRLASMTDESVDRFFTCILCQSFAPAHCCVVTPERLGLCGAVSWLDAKATYELNPNGPSQPILKEGCLDERTGRYTTVNEAIKDATHGAVEEDVYKRQTIMRRSRSRSSCVASRSSPRSCPSPVSYTHLRRLPATAMNMLLPRSTASATRRSSSPTRCSRCPL